MPLVARWCPAPLGADGEEQRESVTSESQWIKEWFGRTDRESSVLPTRGQCGGGLIEAEFKNGGLRLFGKVGVVRAAEFRGCFFFNRSAEQMRTGKMI